VSYVEAGILTFDLAQIDHSCGTALDLHQLPPLRPSIRAIGSPRRYAVVYVRAGAAIIPHLRHGRHALAAIKTQGYRNIPYTNRLYNQTHHPDRDLHI
jgi:hypothetical protein